MRLLLLRYAVRGEIPYRNSASYSDLHPREMFSRTHLRIATGDILLHAKKGSLGSILSITHVLKLQDIR